MQGLISPPHCTAATGGPGKGGPAMQPFPSWREVWRQPTQRPAERPEARRLQSDRGQNAYCCRASLRKGVRASGPCTASLLTAFWVDAGKDLQGRPAGPAATRRHQGTALISRQGLAGATTRTLDRPDQPRCPTRYLPNQASTPAWSQGWYQNSEILPSRKCTTKTSLVEKVSPPRRMVPRCRTIPCSSSAR